ncbi:MAG: hypothetical protein Q7U47_05275 [Paludibacter sp.]|nr:hypothetical protein [Paludibacter sp.]
MDLTNEQNMPTLKKVAALFFFVQTILYLIIFRKEIFTIKFSIKGLLLFTLLLMLIFTVLNIKFSIYITAFFVLISVIYGIINKQFKPHPLFYFIAGYYIFQLIGLLWSIDFILGFKFVGKGLSFLLIPLAFSCFIVTIEDRNKLLKIFFRFLIVYVFMGMIAYLYQVFFHETSLLVGFVFDKHYFHTPVFNGANYYILMGWGGYTHPTFISFILSLMYGVGFYLWKAEKGTNYRISTFEMIFYTFSAAVMIFLLQSRIGMILLPFSIFLSILLSIRKKKKLLTSLVSFWVIAVIIISVLAIKTYPEYFSDPKREYQTDIVVSYIQDHFWTGTGTGGMKVFIPEFPTAHNQFIGEIYHLGIGGFLVFFALVAASFYFAVKNKNFVLLYFSILFFLLMQIDMPLNVQKGITYFTLFTGLFIRPEFDNKRI